MKINKIFKKFILLVIILLMYSNLQANNNRPGHTILLNPPAAITTQEAYDAIKNNTTNSCTTQTTEITPEISALARALKNDPDLIYQYVYNHIEYTPFFGSMKGATGTLIDKMGNSFDQASLLVALFRAAGYDAKFVYGDIQLTGDEIANWLGVKNHDLVIAQILSYAHIPHSGDDVISISIEPTQYSDCGEISINGAVFFSGGSENVTLTWDWGDGTTPITGLGFPAAHRYQNNGKYEVKITANSTTGESAIKKVEVNITTAGSGPHCQTVFLDLHDPVFNGCCDVLLNGVTWTLDNKDSINRISFDWGDGTVNDQWFPGTHTYVNGTYQIAVTSKSAKGGSETRKTAQFTIPNTPVAKNELQSIKLSHVWVQVTIDGTNYVFDPSYKTHKIYNAIDLDTAMGYDHNAFLNAAFSGTESTSSYLKNVNTTNIYNNLTTYSTNLANFIKTNHFDDDIKSIIGGKSIKQIYENPRQTSLKYQTGNPQTWDEIPEQFQTKIRIQLPGIDKTIYSQDMYTKRLTIFYESNAPVLRIDGEKIATGTVGAADTTQAMTYTITHYSSKDTIESILDFTLEVGGYYGFLTGLGLVGKDNIYRHRQILNENIHAGEADLSDAVLGESLALVGLDHLVQSSKISLMADVLNDMTRIQYHTVGFCEYKKGITLDIPISYSAIVNENNNWTQAMSNFYTVGGMKSALEWGVIEQSQDYPAISTINFFDRINKDGDKIFFATSGNFTTDVKPNLKGYSSSMLAHIEQELNTNSNNRYFLPENAQIKIKEWTGYCYFDLKEYSIGYKISGGFHGGKSSEKGHINSKILVDKTPKPISKENSKVKSNEPIDMHSGYYLYDHTDLTIGSSPQVSLGFTRSYNSGNRLTKTNLGLGWEHNFDISATKGSDGCQSLGDRTAIDSVAAIVALKISYDIQWRNFAFPQFITATMINKWLMSSLIDNIVTVKSLDDKQNFTLLPDETYAKPPGVADQLSLINDEYTLTTKHGNKLYYNTDGKIKSFVDPNQNQVSFTYNGDLLSTVLNNFGRGLSFIYDGSNRLTGISDDAKRSISFGYDDSDNLKTYTDTNTNPTTFEYDIDGRLNKIIYPAKDQKGESYPFVTNVYNTFDQVDTQTDVNGNTYSYYFSGFRGEEKNPLGYSNTEYFDDNGNPIQEINPLGNKITRVYDAQNNLTQETWPETNCTKYEYDNNHNVTKIEQYPKSCSSPDPITKRYTYNLTYNKVETYTDPLGNLTKNTYDDRGNLIETDYPQLTGGGQPKENFSYYDNGLLKDKTDPVNMLTSYTYDSSGNNITITIDSNNLKLPTTMTYDPMGNVKTTTDPNGNTINYDYDNMRQLIQITYPGTPSPITKNTYDENGNLTLVESALYKDSQIDNWQTSEKTYTKAGKVETSTDVNGNTTKYEYDKLERIWKITFTTCHIKEFLYDAAGRHYQTFDGFGNIQKQVTYTDNGLQKTLTDANNNTTTYSYDGFDRLQITTFPDSSTKQYTKYDANSNLLSFINRAGDPAITYKYDELNRLIEKDPDSTINYTYDLAGKMETATDSADPTLLKVAYSYDTAGRVLNTTQGSQSIAYEYDNNSNIKKLTYPGGKYYVTYDYDGNNLLTDIVDSNITTLANYTYDTLFRRISDQYSNNTSSSYVYNLGTELKTLSHSFSGSPLEYSFPNYDGVGNVTTMSVNNKSFLPLAPEIVDGVIFDVNDLNQYTAQNGQQIFSYDKNGNLTNNDTSTFGYDRENRLTNSTIGSNNLQFKYYPTGQRAQKAVNSQTTTFVYDGDKVIWEQIPSATKYFVYEPGSDFPVYMETDTGLYVYHYDNLGSVIALSGSNGSIAESYQYTPFGYSPTIFSSVGNPFRFTGRYLDAETGLYYTMARYYDPNLRRYLQPDALEYLPGMNMYAYCMDNPVNFYDPEGEFAISVPTLLVYGVFAVAAAYYGSQAIIETQTILNNSSVEDSNVYLSSSKSSEHKKRGTTNPAN